MEQSAAELLRFQFWPNDLAHVSRVALGSGSPIIVTKFDRTRSTYPYLTYSVLLLIRYVTLWPWPLTPWPWTLAVDRMSHMIKLRTKFEWNWTITGSVIDDLAIFFKECGLPNSTPQRGGGGGPNCSKFGGNSPIIAKSNVLLYYLVLKWGRLEDEWCQRSRPNLTILTPVKIRGGMRENAERDDGVDTITESVVSWQAAIARSTVED